MTERPAEELVKLVAELTDRVDELEQRVDVLEGRATGRDNAGLDHYDGQVIDMMDPDRSYSKRELRTLYERAGVRSIDKIKSRVRHLRQSGVLAVEHGELQLNDDGDE